MSDRCPYCSFDPTNSNDFCDEHRPQAMTNATSQAPCQMQHLQGFRWAVHHCPNMKAREHDTDMFREHYECKVCGKTDYLDYEEMR